MDEQETITGIIRKIRAEANAIEESARGSLKTGESWPGRPFTESDLESALDLAETKRKEADRLEAAHKRECGDAAKLREALEALVANIEMRASVFGIFSIIDRKAFLDAKAALAAPPRNCDRFGGDNAKIQKVYYSECGKNTNPQDPNSRQAYLVGYGNWLLAPATEKEGGAK